jgi:hypothetical protein
MATGSWTFAEELFTRGADEFLNEVRRVQDPERLGKFAAKWFADPRPFARRMLFEYLALPLNSYRHEPLVKRLFKLAEKAGDDEVMGAFLVAFDRCLRRERRTKNRYRHENFPTRATADATSRVWAAEGWVNVRVSEWSGRAFAAANKSEEVVILPGNTTMPRPNSAGARNSSPSENWLKRHQSRLRLFSVPTRRYVRRRAWRYFRLVGKTDPERYVRAASQFIPRYSDEDADSDIHLLDNWGLMHALFRHCDAVRCPASGWEFAAGKSIADLVPAPRHEDAWAASGTPLVELLAKARSTVVRQWCVKMLRKHHVEWLSKQNATWLLKLADSPDPAASEFGFELLERATDLDSIPIEDWLRRLDGDDLAKLDRFSKLLSAKLDGSRVLLDDVLRLAAHGSKPIAELGSELLSKRTFTESDIPRLLPLVQAECAAVRPGIVQWLRGSLTALGPIRPEWLLEFLDSKHADVRAAGWEWLQSSPLKDEPIIWRRLIESPYDDIRGPLVAKLDEHTKGADPDAVRQLWASVLLNVARGSRHKPGVVARVVNRIEHHPAESDRLLPVLAAAVRSLRGPEFRTGLAGLVRLAENKPDLVPAIRERFPELVL